MNVSFMEFKPAFILQPYVESYWKGDFNLNRDNNFSQNVIPNGCIELIIHLTDYHCALDNCNNNYSKSPPFTLIGMFIKPYIVKFAENVKVFGIRFYPDGFRNIFGISPGEFMSTYEDGVSIAGKKLYDFCSFVRIPQSFKKRSDMANVFLTKLLNSNRKEYDITHRAMSLIRQKSGLIDFKVLTNEIPISLRQLQREFKNQYRIKITDYMRLTRLNAINKYITGIPPSLTELAYELDFTDQSHFIREFKHFTGVPPKKFIQKKTTFIVNAV